MKKKYILRAMNGVLSRIDHLSNRFDVYENQWSRTVTELKGNIKSLSTQSNGYNQTIAQLSRGVRSLSDQGNTDRKRLNEVIERLDSQTQFETSEDDARLRNVEKRVADIERRLDTVAYREWKDMAERVSNLQKMIGPPPKPITDEELKGARDAAVQAMRSGRVTFVPDEFSPPIGGTAGSASIAFPTDKMSRESMAALTGGVIHECSSHCTPGHGPVEPKDMVDRLIAEGPFKPGDVIPAWIVKSEAINTIRAALMARGKVKRGCRFCPGNRTWSSDAEFIDHLRDHLDTPVAPRTRTMAIQAAEKRVRNYMDGHFSTATIDGVCAAVRGDRIPPEDHPELDLPRREPLDGIQMADRAPTDRV